MWLTVATWSQCHARAHGRAVRPLLQTCTVSSVSATGYPRATPAGSEPESISVVGVFLLWHLWSNNNPQKKGYQCFLETQQFVICPTFDHKQTSARSGLCASSQSEGHSKPQARLSLSVATMYPQDTGYSKGDQFPLLSWLWLRRWGRVEREGGRSPLMRESPTGLRAGL